MEEMQRDCWEQSLPAPAGGRATWLRSAFPALTCKSGARHPWRARSAGQRSTGPLSRSASPLSPPYSIGTMYGDVQVPRAQDARERPRLSVRRKTALVPTAHRSRLTGHGHGLTIRAKTSTARCAKAVRARFIWPVCVENPGSLVSGYEKQN
jgi:hypothetical protein